MANLLLLTHGLIKTQVISRNWAYNFIKCCNELKNTYSRRYNYQQAKCKDPKIICKWFNLIQITIIQYGITTEDIYNFDETGYTMGLTTITKVVTRADLHGKCQVIQPGNHEWITLIECISSTGWALPPCIIFKGKVHIEGWY